MWHAGILHHACRAGSRHHGGRIGPGKGTLASSYGKLLIAVHHLRLVWGLPLVHVRVLLRRGTAVECLTRSSASRGPEAIRGRIHGWSDLNRPRVGQRTPPQGTGCYRHDGSGKQ